MFTRSARVQSGCQVMQRLRRIGDRSVANEALVTSPVTLTSGHPGPVAIVHVKWPPVVVTRPTVTTSESPGARECGPPFVTTLNEEQPADASTLTGAVPVLWRTKLRVRAPPVAMKPKSSDDTDTWHAAPGACSAALPESGIAGNPAPSDSSQGDAPTSVGW